MLDNLVSVVALNQRASLLDSTAHPALLLERLAQREQF
jgi:hypothetical protein